MSSQDLNDIYAAICDLREARALLWDRVRGTNDRLYDLCKDYERDIEKAERAYRNVSKAYANAPTP